MIAARPALFDDFVLSRNAKLALFIWGAVSVLAMLAYPFAYDQAAFFIGGEKIVSDGAIPYRDFLDTKPPLIFYLYGAAAFLFGHNQWGIRLIDIIWHVGTAVMLYRLIRSHVASESLAYLSTFLYVWQYTTTGYWMTAQAESFAILPSLLVVKCVLEIDDHRAFKLGLLSGIALASIFLLKFTLVLFFLGVIVYLIRHRFRSESIPYLLGTSLSCVVAVGTYIYHLHYAGALPNFVEGLRWVREYAAITPLFSTETIGMEYHKLFPEFMLRTFSITLTAFGVIGLFRIFNTDEKRKPLYSLFLLCLAFALLGVLYERKFFPYHYTRAFVFFSPFVAIGVFATIAWLRHRRVSLGLIGLGSLAFFFSPMMQVYTQTITWPLATALGKNREAMIQTKVADHYAAEQREVGEYLENRLLNKEHMFFWGNGVGVYYYADRLPQTLALTVTPFITDWTSQAWKDTLMSQIERTKPLYFVVEHGDSRSYISGTKLDSYDQLRKWQKLSDHINANYFEEKRIGHFIIFRRR
jgi:hypothetical protein